MRGRESRAPDGGSCQGRALAVSVRLSSELPRRCHGDLGPRPPSLLRLAWALILLPNSWSLGVGIRQSVGEWEIGSLQSPCRGTVSRMVPKHVHVWILGDSGCVHLCVIKFAPQLP